MLNPAIILIASLPLIFRLAQIFIPGTILEPYTWWSGESLNHRDGYAPTQWLNMGYWDGTEFFAEANEALGRRLLELAAVHPESVLDIAHGPGESLSLHLSRTPPPRHLHALTSRRSDTHQAQALVAERHGNTTTAIEWYTSSASYRPGKDHDHPLNPMRGFLGKRQEQSLDDNDDFDDTVEVEAGHAETRPPPYDLVYILDGIYHFPPSLPYFLSTVLPVLTPTTGVVVYTDILPPANLHALLRLILPALLSVPPRDLVADRGRPLEEYTAGLGKLGFTDVVIQDWTEHVLPGFAGFLKRRGSLWWLVGNVVERAEKSGWKFVAVRARRP